MPENSPTRVLLLRHAETANPFVFHGAESDVGLSEPGQRQAEAAAEALLGFRADRLVSSGMRRALDTAAPIARLLNLPIIIERDLHERRVGALAGTSTQSGDGGWPETLRHWMAGNLDYAPKGAESYAEIRARVLPAWKRVVSKGQTTIVVAHGVVVKVLLLSLLPGYTVADWQSLGPIRNVGISELQLAGENWSAVRLNDVPPRARIQSDQQNPS
jgi:broad specificity phosphatase PhoE